MRVTRIPRFLRFGWGGGVLGQLTEGLAGDIDQHVPELLGKNLGGHGLAAGEPAEDGCHKGVLKKGDVEGRVLNPLEDVLGEGLEEGGDGLDEVVPEGILPFDEQGAAVEVPFLVKICLLYTSDAADEL